MSNNIAAPPPPGPRVDDDVFGYSTVGELYGLLEQGIRSFPEAELFVGGASPQLGPETAHFPDLLRVRDRASALEAIHRIRHQGEGTSNDDTDCHHGIFAAILAEVGATTAANASFAPVRATSTPVPGAPSGGPHEKAGKLFDDVYLLLLRMMAWGTAADPVDAAETARFAGASIEMMVTVLKPLGDRMFGTAAHPGPGPSFGLGRVLALPGSAATASRIVAEQLGSLAARVERTHAENGWSPGRVPEALRRIAARFG
jgi:hypothetical protein